MIASTSPWIALALAAVPMLALAQPAEPSVSPGAGSRPAPSVPASADDPLPPSDAPPRSRVIDDPLPPSEIPGPPAAPPPVGPRPEGPTLGLGAGYALPTALDLPNLVSARVRIGDRYTIEPRLELSRRSERVEVDGVVVDDATWTYVIGASLRTAIAQRGRGDLIVVGGASIEHAEDNPEGDSNTTASTVLAIDWGLAIDTWLTRSLVVSATATNPVLVVTDQSTESTFGAMSEGSTSLSLSWDPQLAVMIHLFW